MARDKIATMENMRNRRTPNDREGCAVCTPAERAS